MNPPLPLIEQALLQSARGMSDDALRRALGIRARDWPGIKAELDEARARASLKANRLEAEQKAQPLIVTPAPVKLDMQGMASEAKATEWQKEMAEKKAKREAARDLRRESRQKFRDAMAARTALQKLQLRDQVKARMLQLRQIVLQEAEMGLKEMLSGKRSRKPELVRGYLCWLLRSHVPMLTLSEIAQSVERSTHAVYSMITATESRLQSPELQPFVIALHARVRKRLDADRQCKSCDGMKGEVQPAALSVATESVSAEGATS